MIDQTEKKVNLMLLKNPPLKIEVGDPFVEDDLYRKKNAEILTNLVSTFREPFVLCIDSPWGTGKTTFIKMWRQHLINNGFHTLYFNAWENDFSNDPLVSLIGEIDSALDEFRMDGKQRAKAKKLFKETKKNVTEILKKMLPMVLNVATSGILNINKDAEAKLSEFVENLAEDKLKKYNEAKKSIKQFKERLSKFTRTISSTDNLEQFKPLIFFIDEMDRCRPTFAIELLENAKHLFDVEGIIFVLAVDKGQLEHSIRSVYGEGMNADGYLRRFIDLTFHLPEPPVDAFCNSLMKKLGIIDYLNDREEKVQGIDNYFAELFSLFGFSLRVQEQCLSQLSVAIRLTPGDKKIFWEHLGTLIVLKSANKTLYNRFIKKICDVREIIDFILERPGGKGFVDEYNGVSFEYILAELLYGYEMDTPGFRTNEYDDIIKDENASKARRQRAEDILRHLKTISFHRRIPLDYIVKQIEMTEKFY